MSAAMTTPSALYIEDVDEVVNSDFPDETDSRQSFDEC